MKTILRSIRPVWLSVSLVLPFLLSACSLSVPRLSMERSGIFSLSPEASCEPSGAVYHRGYCIFVNDKPIPGRSPVFRFPVRDGRLLVERREDLSSPLFREGRKWEDIARTPGGSHLLAVTAFDRREEPYNHLVSWRAGAPGNAVRKSVPLGDWIRAVLGGDEYIKVEGLTCLPNDILLFGIRARGKSWRESSNVCQIVALSCEVRGGSVILGDDLRLWFDAGSLPVPEAVGISGLEYDFERNRLYVLFSFEEKGRLGGYLGVMTPEAGGVVLVRDSGGALLRFDRKAEGITVLDRDRVLVVFDDDRVESRGRKKNEAVYSIFRWK